MVSASKLKTKIFNKVIKKLGSTLTITPYTKGVKDAFGSRSNVAGTPYNIIAVEAEENKQYFDINQEIKASNNTISLFIDPSLNIQDSDTTYYQFTWFGVKYRYESEDIIGSLQNIQIVKILYLRRDE